MVFVGSKDDGRDAIVSQYRRKDLLRAKYQVVTGSGHKTDKKSNSSLKTGASQSQDQHHEINYSN